jgi:hypothetical protein
MKYIVNFTVSEGKLNGFFIQYIILRMPSQKSCNVFLAWTLLTEASRYRYIWFRHICHLFVIRYSVLIMTADLTYSWILMFCFIQKANWFRNHYSGSGSWTTTEQKAATRLFHLSRVPVVVEPSYRLHSEHFCARRCVVPWFALFLQVGTGGAEDAQLSGDSIPIGCEASYLEARLDSSLDSGMASLTRDPPPHAALPALNQVRN